MNLETIYEKRAMNARDRVVFTENFLLNAFKLTIIRFLPLASFREEKKSPKPFQFLFIQWFLCVWSNSITKPRVRWRWSRRLRVDSSRSKKRNFLNFSLLFFIRIIPRKFIFLISAYQKAAWHIGIKHFLTTHAMNIYIFFIIHSIHHL